MASPVKDGGPAHAAVIDTLIRTYRPGVELQDALSERGDMFDVKVRAMSVVKADRALPKYERLGMRRIAWLFHVTVKTLYEWWTAYEGGGVDALRSGAGGGGREARAGGGTPAKAGDAPPARKARAAAGRNVRGAKRMSVVEFGEEIKKRTGVEYSRSRLYALRAALEKRERDAAADAAARGEKRC